MIQKHLVFGFVLFSCFGQVRAEGEGASRLQELLHEQVRDTHLVQQLWALHDDLDASDYSTRFKTVKLGLDVSDSLDYTRGISATAFRLGRLYEKAGINEEAFETYEICMAAARQRGDTNRVAWVYNSLGNLHKDMEYFEQCEEYFLESFRLLDELGSPQATYPLINLASAYNEMDSNAKSLDLYNSLLTTYHVPDDLIRNSTIHNNLGFLLEELGRHDEALENLMLAKKMKHQAGRIASLPNTYNNIAKVSVSKGDYATAQLYLDSTWAVTNWKDFFSERHEATLFRSQLEAARGNHRKAYELSIGYQARQDSVVRSREKTKLKEIMVVFQADQQQARLDLLEKDREILLKDQVAMQSRQKFQWTLIIGLGAVALLLGGLFVVNIRLNRRLRSAASELGANNKQIKLQQQEILRQKEAVEEKNRALENAIHEKDGLIGFVAHDLKAPFQKIMAVLSMLQEEEGLSEQGKSMLGMIRKTSEGGNDLIKDLLLISEAEDGDASAPSGESTVVSLNEFVHRRISSFQPYANKKGIQIRSNMELDDFKVQSDPRDVGRILDNFISNAIKFSPPGKEVEVGVRQLGDRPTVYVKDEGPGISPEDQKRLFKKFQKLSARPTGGESSHGLGLAIVKSLADRLNGEVALYSQPGSGTTFEFIFPIQS